MSLISNQIKKSPFILFTILVLCIQNLIIFWDHYFNRIGFPWDFVQSYYVTPAFWTTAIDLGISPQWIPFQSMGYPLLMKINAGFHYLPYWIFPLINIQYTLQVAVIFQILHILLGSIGMFILLTSLFKSPKYGIIGAIAFQFFGGFYANSEHVDIVRGFAFVPWLFYFFTLNLKKPVLTKKILFIPVILFLIATGAYPGIFVSSIFMMTVFIFLQIINGYTKNLQKQQLMILGGSLFGLLLLGITMSVVQLGPILDNGDNFSRFDDRSQLAYNKLTLSQIPGLFMSNTPIPGEPSMTSTFLTLPILILASFITWKNFKKYWLFFPILIVGILMSLGDQTPFWIYLTSLIPILDLSRFPVSDYRIFIAIPILIFSISGLKSIITREINLSSFYFRIPFIITWFTIGIIILQNNISKALLLDLNLDRAIENLNQQINISIVILLILVFVIFLYSRKSKTSIKKYSKNSVIIIMIVASLIMVDGFLVITDMYTWHRSTYDQIYVHFNLPLEKDGNLITYSIFDNLPETRPERKITKHIHDISWRGMLTGDYMMQDSGLHAVLNSRTIVESNEIYMNYMGMKWTPIFLQSDIVGSSKKIEIDQGIFILKYPQTSPVSQTFYGINDIFYKVSLDEPKLMIENEMYFSGWTAILSYPDKEVHLQAIEVNDVFRAWELPAGDYEMKATFQFPNLSKYYQISFGAFLTLILISILYIFKTYKLILKKSEIN